MIKYILLLLLLTGCHNGPNIFHKFSRNNCIAQVSARNYERLLWENNVKLVPTFQIVELGTHNYLTIDIEHKEKVGINYIDEDDYTKVDCPK